MLHKKPLSFTIVLLQGEEQQKLDVLANTIFINFLRNSYTCCFLVSEEMDKVVEVESEKQVKNLPFYLCLIFYVKVICL